MIDIKSITTRLLKKYKISHYFYCAIAIIIAIVIFIGVDSIITYLSKKNINKNTVCHGIESSSHGNAISVSGTENFQSENDTVILQGPEY